MVSQIRRKIGMSIVETVVGAGIGLRVRKVSRSDTVNCCFGSFGG